MPRIVKDCFGTVISTLSKMRECVRCELLADCRSINWTASGEDSAPVVLRRPGPGDGSVGDSASADGNAVDPGR